MMSYLLNVSQNAEEDIENQRLWYEADPLRGGFDLSERWMAALIEQMEDLKCHPERFPFAPENGRWLPHLAIRQMLFRPWKNKAGWRVLYVIKARKKVVTVLQVRHEHRKWLHDL